MNEADPEQHTRLNRELHTVTEVAKTLTAPLPINELLNAIMDKIIGVLEPAEIGAVMIWDSSSGLFRAQAAFGYDLEILKEVGLRAGEAITGKVYDLGSALLLNTPEQVAKAMMDMRTANRDLLAKSLHSDALPICTVAAPISVSEHKYGVLILETIHGPETFTTEDLPFVQTLADLIALAIERARLIAKADSDRALRERDRLESELLATLSHELRMPLTAIKGYATALLLDEIDWSEEKQVEFLELIEGECDNMQVLLTDFIDSSIIEINQITIDRVSLHLDELCQEVADEIQRRTSIHNLMADFPVDFPAVEADPHRIRQILRNILDNAIKYSPEGGLIIIQGEIRSEDIVVHIADQGIGISPEELIPLFEKYRRSHAEDVHLIAGMGLGLPIARTLVEAHSGRIWAESTLGQGTTLSFSLPRTIPGKMDIVESDEQ